jgi:putative hemolysin
MRMLPFVLLVSVIVLAGCLQQKDCRVPSDCDSRVHPNCSSDWMCVDGKCVWDCGGCSLSLCDCKCHPTGQTPEELTGRLCGINCQKEFNVSGCQYRGGACAELYVEPEKNVTIANPASVYCVDKGHRSEIKTAPDGSQYGVCILSDGLECEEWSFYHGNCIISSVSSCNTNIGNISSWKGVNFVGGIDRMIVRQNLSYVCCANVSVSLNRNGSVLRIYENNVGKVCRCICGYYLNITVPELSAGTYHVEVYGVSFEETEGTLLGNATVSVGAKACSSDDDCVPEQCCHPTSCTNKDSKGVCNMMCTQECQAGTMDCGQGRCACKKGKCDVEWAQLETG